MSDCSRHVSLLLLYGVKAWLCGSIARVNHPNRPFKLFRAGFGTPTSCYFVSQGPLEFLLGPPPRPPGQMRRSPYIVLSVLCQWSCCVLSWDVVERSLELRSSRNYLRLIGSEKALQGPVDMIIDGCCLCEKVQRNRKRVPMNSTLGEICRWRLVACKRFGRRFSMSRSKCALGEELQRASQIFHSC